MLRSPRTISTDWQYGHQCAASRQKTTDGSSTAVRAFTASPHHRASFSRVGAAGASTASFGHTRASRRARQSSLGGGCANPPPRSAARVVASVAHDATTQAIVKTRMAATYSRRWHHGRNSLKEMAPAASMLKIRVHQKHRSQGQRKASRVVAQSRAGALETSIKLQLIDHLRRRCGFGLISQTSPNSVQANSRVQNEPCKRCVRPD